MPQSLNDQLLVEFADALGWSDWMFAIISEDAFFERPIPLRHQSIFYYGHLPAFAWNHVFRMTLKRGSHNQIFDELFERGIDPPDTSFPAPARDRWPALTEITAYKSLVESDLKCLLETVDLESRQSEQLREALQLVLEHYYMHVETFLYMQHQLGYRKKRSFPAPPFSQRQPTKNSRDHMPVMPAAKVKVPAGWVTLGAPRDGRFGWCNEFGEIRLAVKDFVIDRLPVTNKQFLCFMENGGYHNRDLWSADAWNWLKNAPHLHPLFWQRDGSNWFFRGMFGLEKLDENCPAWVSHAEAAAYATWLGASLPTEEQFHRAAFGTANGEREFPWGDGAPDESKGNFGLIALSPVPVGSYPEGVSYFGVEELVGNGWEWTGSRFCAWPGFKPLPTYPGYSSDFFDERHFVMKGASPVTASRLLRRSFRNWFQPHYPYVYAKFRCVYNKEAS